MASFRRVNRSRKTGIAPIIIIVASIFVVSAVIAGVWHFLSPGTDPYASITLEPKLMDGPIAVIQEDSSDMPVLPPVVESLPAPIHPSLSDPSTGRVGNDYFDDAAFVGDSITTGIKIYDIMSNADVFAETGLGLHNIMTRECINLNGSKVTILDALKQTNPKKIYVMLGGNSLGAYEQDALVPYERFVDAIAQQHPDSVLYIQSVLPIHETTYQAQYKNNLTNAKIASFNELLKSMCESKGYVYLDVASIFVDAQGGMPAEYTPDGVHINSTQYIMWFDYLKNNTKQS